MNKIRPFQIPQDLDIMLKLIEDGFQYPEKPDWNFQNDEKESLLDSVNSIRRLWPMIQIFKFFVPFLGDIMYGFIYEEDNRPVGLVNFGRQRNVTEWYVGNVTVLPGYRRRGIARKLIEASLEELRDRRAQAVLLEVIDENLPAYRLYEALGFTAYSGSSDYDIQLNEPVSPAKINDDLILKILRLSDWETRLEFARRITPERIQSFEPVRKDRFKPSLAIRILAPLLQTLSGSSSERFALIKNGKIVSIGEFSYRTKPGGMNKASVQADPDYPEFAPVVLNHILSSLQGKSPGRRLEIHLRNWQPALLQAAEDAGCTKRFSYHQMAKRFD